MFINDVHKKEEIQNLAIADLKTLGIKYRPKKSRQHVEETKSRKVFKRSLNVLSFETVTLPSGQQLIVPKIVHALCSFIVMKIDTEGLFRKGGSKNRQNEIKLLLDAGCNLTEEHHVIDIASVLKTFFRELPEPLLPYSYHELFLRCMLLHKDQVEATLLACLLLPTVHLNTLAYFMQFLHRVADYHEFNKMDAYNLAVVIGPTLFPAEEKIPQNANLRMTKTCELFKLLIENAPVIGVLNESIIERIAQSSNDSPIDDDTQSVKKKKKRRSGSLTRMLSGLKKIVTHKSEDVPQPTPDILVTPCVTRSAKKRKIETAGMSAKKRQEIMGNLPQSAILNTPFTPRAAALATPVNSHPNGKKKTPERSKSQKIETAKEKRTLWSSNKTKNKKNDETASTTSSIQRRWSAVSSAAGFKKKKARNSCIQAAPPPPAPQLDPHIDENYINVINEERTKLTTSDPDYVRIPKAEYEEIKNRVSAIERRISIELESVPPTPSPEPPVRESAVEEVNKKYEETLVQNEPLCTNTDQLARRLSRELKIRRSDEQRPVFRSPSARKIGSLRRKEGQSQVRLSRTQTWCVANKNTTSNPMGTRNSIRRRNEGPKPSTLSNSTNSSSFARSTNSSLSRSGQTISSTISSNVTDSSGASWKSAQGFFSTPDVSHNPALDTNCRASLARLRNQNAGMVMARARLFDNLGDSTEKTEPTLGTPRRTSKMGATRMQINRIRTLRMEDRRKKSMSPRKRPCRSPGIHRLPKGMARSEERAGAVLKEFNRIDSDSISTPSKVMPVIKRNLNTKSPRRVGRTPLSITTSVEMRRTPMKATRLALD